MTSFEIFSGDTFNIYQFFHVFNARRKLLEILMSLVFYVQIKIKQNIAFYLNVIVTC